MKGLHGIIFAFEERTGLRELVLGIRCSASIPFGGRYRAVDFALSSMVNAGITDVGVVTHGQYQSLLDHLGTGKAWDLSRRRGGLRFLPPFKYKSGWALLPYRGKIEALAGIRSYLDTIHQDYVVMTDGDLVANMPFNDIYREHLRSGADITAVCGNDSFKTEDGTYFEMDHNHNITETFVNLRTPRGYRGLDTFIISTQLLKELVDECSGKDQFSWRRHVLQAKKDELHLHSYIWGGYAAQIRSVQEYYDRSMQLLEPEIRADLFTHQRPILAKASNKSSTYIGSDGYIGNSLVADGCRIEGIVKDSILFPGVVVEKGAVVEGCVLFREAVIRNGAQIRYTIGDKDIEVGENKVEIGDIHHPLVLEKGCKV